MYGAIFQLFVKISPEHLTLFSLPMREVGTVRLHVAVVSIIITGFTEAFLFKKGFQATDLGW